YLGKINDNSVAFIFIVVGVYAFNYYRQLFLEKTRIAELNRTLAETKLEQLKTQLQPHFLFNTLNTITALIHTDPEKADLVTTKLSDFLRTSLAKEHQQMTRLDEEIDLLKKYLEIQQVRFEDRLTISFEIPQDTKSALVPYLILQPLAENAVKHGISKQSGDGKIEIISKIDGDTLVLTVRNSNAQLDDSFSIEQHAQIGLKNTVERLQYIYQQNASFTILNNNNSVEAVITIPYQNR
ncbi:MAG: sensor histidine kinase, partial [Calditrichaeota bacterium]